MNSQGNGRSMGVNKMKLMEYYKERASVTVDMSIVNAYPEEHQKLVYKELENAILKKISEILKEGKEVILGIGFPYKTFPIRNEYPPQNINCVEYRQEIHWKPVKHGEWIRINSYSLYKCSACGEESYVSTCMGEPLYNYCPRCGARMDEKEDAE